MGGSTTPRRSTLDVWDAKLADAGERFGHARAALVERVEPARRVGLRRAWPARPAGDAAATTRRGAATAWRRRWRRRAADDVRRGVSTVGPHRDELDLRIGDLPARTHASQGEQRTLALALRLGAHRLVAERTGSTPVLVLDDVLSELDAHRADRPAAVAARRPGRDHHRRRDPRRRRTPTGSSASRPAPSSDRSRSADGRSTIGPSVRR